MSGMDARTIEAFANQESIGLPGTIGNSLSTRGTPLKMVTMTRRTAELTIAHFHDAIRIFWCGEYKWGGRDRSKAVAELRYWRAHRRNCLRWEAEDAAKRCGAR